MKRFAKTCGSIILLAVACSSAKVSAQNGPFVSRSLSNETVTGPKGEVTVPTALTIDQRMGADEKVAQELTDGVYQIRGWGIAHTIAIDAPAGWIVIDTGDSTATAREMRQRLEETVGEKINVAAVLYTHSHYTDGTDAWLDEGTEIWGHEDLDKHKRADGGVSILSGNYGTRAMIQFGALHPSSGPDAFPNSLGFGIDKFVGEKSYRAPTRTFEDGQIIETTIAGETVEVAPNRTDVQDSVGFYFPDRETLVTNAMGGSIIFNLYTLRGDMYRNPADYVDAHEWALTKNANVLADIHSRGLVGRAEVREALERASDQIQLINDQTLRMIAKGMDGRESAENVYMPPHMRDGYENYGQMESHVKQVYSGRVGWMGNDVYDINPLAVNEEASRTIELMGGPNTVRQAARDSVEKGDFENWSWALKLTSMLLKRDQNDALARQIRADASRAMGQRTSSANARGFYITEALAMEAGLKLGDQPVSLDIVRTMLGAPDIEKLLTSNIDDSFQYLRYLVDPRKAEDSRSAFTVAIEGESELRQIELRNSVVVISHAEKKGSNHVNVSRREWGEFIIGERSLAQGNEAIALFESVLDRTDATSH